MRTMRRFQKDTGGATAVVFALTLVPVLGMAGAALDYSRATSARTDIQRAVDATAVALVREPASATAAQLQAKGETLVKTLVQGHKGLAMDAITVQRDAKTIRVEAGGSIKSSLLSVLGVDIIPVSTGARVAWGTNKIELALVLDNTGSMNETPMGLRKIDELKKASKRMLLDLRSVANEPDAVKVAIVPFDTEVRLETKYRDEDWLRWQNPADKAKWSGYVTDRDMPYDANDDAPTSQASKYPALAASQYATCWNGLCGDIAPMRALTSVYEKVDYDALKSTIDVMRPRGYTNIGLGMAWGLAALTPGAPFVEGAPAGEAKKFVVLLTDGDNTWSRNKGFAAGAIDDRTRFACTAAKKSATVYTIRLVSGNASLLRDCATSANHYFDVTDPSKLEGVFKTIMNEISGVRYTH